MNKRNSCATQRFGSILKKVNAEGLFEECANGSLEAYAHNGRTIDTFRIPPFISTLSFMGFSS